MLRAARVCGCQIALATSVLHLNHEIRTKSIVNCNSEAEKKIWPFDNRGLPTKIVPVTNSSSPLFLSGVGMRRKNLYIVEVDVYLVGVGLSEAALRAAQDWSGKKDVDKPLSTFVLNAGNAGKANNVAKAAIVLRLVRSVTNAQFVEAFREAFTGFNAEDFDAFKSVVNACVGEKLNVNDEFSFYLLDGGEIVVAKNGNIGGRLIHAAMATRLLDVYSDPKRIVSSELYKSLEKNVPVLGEKLRLKDAIFLN